MTSSQSAPACRVISIASARPGPAAQLHSVLALIRGQRVINLAEVAESIRADRGLSSLITEAACRDLGRPRLSVEEAIVLLGGQGLCSLLSSTRSHRSLRSVFHGNRISPKNLRLSRKLQEVPE